MTHEEHIKQKHFQLIN